MLFNTTIFGPIRSRRLGNSLGINLLPNNGKICSFDCIYCECGLNKDGREDTKLSTREEVKTELEAKLKESKSSNAVVDTFTFAGNGEPTMHPEFEQIIDDTIALRDEFCPSAKVSVLSNATQIHREDVCRALHRVDNNILKLDSAFDTTVRLMNNPAAGYSVADTVERMKHFSGQMTLQTMFLRGEYQGQHIDNTSCEEVAAWLELVKEISPRQVMVYSLDRDTPCKTLEKVSREELMAIAHQVEELGIPCSVA